MKLLTADGGVWWISKVDEVRAPNGISLQRIISAVRDTFNFSSIPTGVPKEGEAYAFGEGFLDANGDEIVVRTMELYQNGLHIVTPGGTERADKVLRHTIELFSGLGMKYPESAPVQFYTSEIVVDLAKSLDSLIANYTVIRRLLEPNLPLARHVHLAAIALNADPKSMPLELVSINPTIFRIERRTGESYASNRYFSFANATTINHLAILEGLEKVV
jgi:hypothetical protein